MSYNPDQWLTSLQRTLSGLISDEIDAYIQDAGGDAGLKVYDVVFDWPDAAELATGARLEKTIIHFVIDDINNLKLGFGDDTVSATEITITDPDTITYHEGQRHELNFDVGVWASDKSGGSTARLVVYEMLQRLFSMESGRRKVRLDTDGVEILRFNGGRFITDKINDVRVYRIIDSELVVRVFSRLSGDPAVIVDQEPDVTEQFEIDNINIS